jgi:hypothetical protein
VQDVRSAPGGLTVSLRIDAGGRSVEAVHLSARVQIRAERRRYSDIETGRLWELFGPAEAWARSLGPIPWIQAQVEVGRFTGCTSTELRLPCEFGFGAAAPKYLDALAEGVVPLELLFSGTLSWTTDAGRLQTAMIPWDREGFYRMPIDAWHEARAGTTDAGR